MKRLRTNSLSLSSKVFALLLMALMLVEPFDTMTVNAFTNQAAASVSKAVRRVVSVDDSKRPPTALRMTNFFDDLRNFFDPSRDDSNDDDQDDGDDDDDVPAGQYRVVSISVEAIKPGGLRLFLMLYLMGMQNTPDANSWKANQPSTDDYVLDFWYHDHSAILSITLSEEDKLITIDRVGSNPSTAYMIHESTIVQGILDELEQMATDSEVTPENRLLVVEPANAIDNARDALAFG